MDVIVGSLMSGFAVALKPINLFYALLGAILGTITGVLPGIGPTAAMTILLSFTLGIDATSAMIMFAGIYYGAMYGGSTTSILLNIPGEAASVITCIDGYEMAKKGRAGAALTVAAVGSFVAGTISIIGLMIGAAALSNLALKFGPPEFLAIGVCGLVILVRLSNAPPLKSMMMVFFGMAVATVGIDLMSGNERFTFGIYELGQGIDFLPVAMGLFGITEVMVAASESKDAHRQVIRVRLRDLFPTIEEWRRSTFPALRGSVIGFMIGLIPGPSPVISTFVSYMVEKKLAKNPKEFGHGAIEGVAGPEAANNAAVGGAFVPLMALGIPFTPAMAMILASLLLHNVTPGPGLIRERPELFWGVIASMYVGNLMLLVLNLPLVGIFSKIMKIPTPLLIPVIIVLCWVGVFSINNSYLDLLILAFFGVVGYVVRELEFEPAPLVLALVIGPMIETSLRQSLKLMGGSVAAVITRPICLTLYVATSLFILGPQMLKLVRKGRLPEGRRV
jgi:putative tricarboxylic transport membrane protein